MASEIPDFSGALNSLFRGKAKWTAQHDVMRDFYTLGFQCDRLTPVLTISQRALEDAIHSPTLIATRCLEFYERHHRLLNPREPVQPMLTCRECRSPVDLPRADELDFEFCERQSVLWAERAANMVKR